MGRCVFLSLGVMEEVRSGMCDLWHRFLSVHVRGVRWIRVLGERLSSFELVIEGQTVG